MDEWEDEIFFIPIYGSFSSFSEILIIRFLFNLSYDFFRLLPLTELNKPIELAS